MIIRFKPNNGKENVFKHIFQGYILPKDKQSMISMTGYNVENSLGRGDNFHDITHTTVFGQFSRKQLVLGFKCSY